MKFMQPDKITRQAALIKARQFVLAIALTAFGSAMTVSAQNDGEDKITIKTQVVFVDALVKDKKNDAPIRNLTRGDFTVLDDGRVRELSYFNNDARRARALMLVIDFAGEWARVLHDKETVSRLAALLAKLPPEDELAIAISWLGKADSPCSPLKSDSPNNPPPLRILQDFTRDRGKMVAALESVPELSAKYRRDYKRINWNFETVNTAPGIACAAETLRRASAQRPNSQPVMVVAADDAAYFPFTVRDELIRGSLETGMTINLLRIRPFFLVGWGVDKVKKTDFRETPGTVEVIADITKQTGGEMARAGGVKKYVAAFEKLIGDLTARYALGFTLDENEPNTNRLHKLEVRVKARDERGKERNAVVSARNGYYLPK